MKEATKDHAGPVDVLVLTAVQDELDAVLAVGEAGRWTEQRDLGGFRYFRRTHSGKRGSFVVAAAWIGEMGGRAAAIRGQQLLSELSPSCLAMCGVCAGDPQKVSLGDVIVADRLFAWDEGKRVAEPGKEEAFYHVLRSFDLEAAWKMEAAFLAKEIDLAELARGRPPSREVQRRWFLFSLAAHESGKGPTPAEHPERREKCPSWTALFDEALSEGLIALSDDGVMSLAPAGRMLVARDRLRYPDGLPSDPPLRVHVGAVATVSAVTEDPGIFERMRKVVRSALGLELEGAALGELSSRFDKRSILVKAVQDFADGSKDDSFRSFACRASAEFLFAFLERHFEPERRERETEHERERRFDLRMLERGGEDPFLGRVERIVALRHPEARMTRHLADAPFAGLLEVEIDAGGFFDVRLVAALDRPVTEESFAAFVSREERPFRDRYPLLRSTLVHQGDVAPRELRELAFRRGVELTTFRAYQGLFDLTSYLEWQTARLEASEVYPPSIYVDQPATYELSGIRERHKVEDALHFLWDLLASPDQRRFALVLGEFGAGKTFLLRELCRRMATERHPVWPVLVEMASLEKTHDLPALLAAHFAQADVPGYNFKAFRYMLEEGRIALLFDGFDELADRVTYETVHAHFDTVLSAAQGGVAKVLLSSRRQHFLSESQVKLELTRRAEGIPGFHMMLLLPFEEPQIRRYLRNVLGDERAADERYALIDEVKDLLGLSHNPRMLGFIARLPESSLRAAKEKDKEITAAKLYELLVKDWLDFEYERSRRVSTRKGISREALGKGMAVLAMSMWHAKQKTVEVEQIREVLAEAMWALGEPVEDADVVAHLFGSGSLLVRDGEGRFSFVHRSVMEWFVAREAAAELKSGGDSAALGVDEMSALMADFFHSMAGRDLALEWARGKVFGLEKGIATKNAALVLQRLGGGFELVDFSGQDLRGSDFSGIDWRGANLRAADLSGTTLEGADLSGADLTGARLSRANLTRVKLVGATLGAADLRFARLLRAELSASEGLEEANLWGANLVGASGVPAAVADAIVGFGGVPPTLQQATPAWASAASLCFSVAFNPRGDLLAAGYGDGTVWLFDVVAGHLLRILVGHTDSVYTVAWSPDGQSLASGSSDNTIRLWEVSSGRSSRIIEGHAKTVLCVAWRPDGQVLASGSSDKTIRLWDVASGYSSRVLEEHTNRVLSVAWSPDGKVLASGSEDTTVRLWDVASGRSSRVLNGHVNSVNNVAWSPDGKVLASGSDDTTVCLWSVGSRRSSRVLEGHTDWVRGVVWSPDGKSLASGSYDKTVRIWEPTSGRCSRVLKENTSSVLSVAWNPDGKALVSGSEEDTVRLWDIASGRSSLVIDGHMSWVSSVVWSPNGKALASGSSDKTVRLWDVTAGRFSSVLEGHTHTVMSIAWRPGGKVLASGSVDHTIGLWNVGSGRFSRVLEGHTGSVMSVAWSPDGKHLASGSSDSTVRLWGGSLGRCLRIFTGHKNSVDSVAWSPDGQLLASGSSDNTVRLWDVAAGRSSRVLEGHSDRVLSVAWNSNGNAFASSSENTVRLWDVASGWSPRVLEGHANWVWSVAWSPDGRALASGSDDKTIRLWDVTSGRASRVLEGHTNWVRSVAWSPDGKHLASGSADNTVRIWDVASGTCLAILLATRDGWVAFTPDGRYKMGGSIRGSFWHVVGLCRFEPGEIDEFLPHLRMADDEPFLR